MIIYRELDMSNQEADSKVLTGKNIISGAYLSERSLGTRTHSEFSLLKQPIYDEIKLAEVAEVLEATN